ncbi:hypothetical protein KIH41_11155 [Litoribacter ruber]|uniref:Uncharacterized protein n=1 Tax=Litoribacter ruber TaxID=702568 RepID=A0AAP2G5D9_9BACT|nr:MULTISPECIES: hypothetical protein [Litoribacter]MBS9525006.1 hypothetical protein [Litoribacter alkaliphilus]MBT0811835.1 hypothetical protein [Litoribacter ruber]
MKYVIKLEINGVDFEINTEASNEREAKDIMWETIRKSTAIRAIDVEPVANGKTMSSRFVDGLKSALLL